MDNARLRDIEERVQSMHDGIVSYERFIDNAEVDQKDLLYEVRKLRAVLQTIANGGDCTTNDMLTVTRAKELATEALREEQGSATGGRPRRARSG